jgi:LysM repeat protein
VSVSELAAANPQLIKAGNVLKVPTAVAPFRKNKSSAPSGSAPKARRYKIQRGDTLTLIAVQYGTTVAAIASTNKIKDINNPIKIGQVLVIP